MRDPRACTTAWPVACGGRFCAGRTRTRAGISSSESAERVRGPAGEPRGQMPRPVLGGPFQVPAPGRSQPNARNVPSHHPGHRICSSLAEDKTNVRPDQPDPHSHLPNRLATSRAQRPQVHWSPNRRGQGSLTIKRRQARKTPRPNEAIAADTRHSPKCGRFANLDFRLESACPPDPAESEKAKPI
jgi:hypothetical protein